MNRLGATLLLAILVIGVGFLLLVRRAEHSPAPPVVAATGALVVPVAGVMPASLTDSWGDARGGGTRVHHAIDIMAPTGTTVVAAAPGRVEKIFESANGGHTVYVRSDDAARIYYYAHLDSYAPDLVEGQRVTAGTPLGTVGATGDASPEAPHLHFEVKLMNAGEAWHQGTEVNPYPLLKHAVAGSSTAR